MKKSFARHFARSVIFLLLSAFLLLASACSSQPNGKPSGTSEVPSDRESENSGAALPTDAALPTGAALPAEIPSGASEIPSDLEGAPRMIARDTGKGCPLSEDDARYLSELIGNAKIRSGVWKCTFDYDFVLGNTTWSYCTLHGTFSNLSEEKNIAKLSETEQARLNGIIAAGIGAR